MATDFLRSVGMHLHPAGPLTVANMVLNPNMSVFDGSGNLTSWTPSHCTFQRSTTQVKFGTYSGKVIVTSTTLQPSVLQSFAVTELQTYTASMWLNIPVTISTGLSMFAQLYASDNTPMDLLGGAIVTGAATGGWIRTSRVFTIPVGASRMEISYVYPTTQSTAFDVFYIDGVQLEPGNIANQYVDGDMSGYVWSGTKGLSTTLKSEFPSALRSFMVGPFRGTPSGMVARSEMNGHNVIPLKD